jgi:hypothetical protein
MREFKKEKMGGVGGPAAGLRQPAVFSGEAAGPCVRRPWSIKSKLRRPSREHIRVAHQQPFPLLLLKDRKRGPFSHDRRSAAPRSGDDG